MVFTYPPPFLEHSNLQFLFLQHPMCLLMSSVLFSKSFQVIRLVLFTFALDLNLLPKKSVLFT
ncbi:hypothetical protein OUZ56_005708 [Daphnia magna]|uniref:Uncharacterized protein n=1 Tax=Daphnia magna TaxID=35525 RepID=A0ABQ9YU81_9CRUS|nr:hypothetical protein OUZ56_005708 [Daphnia magna]